jgi:hypothetical protein
MYCTVSWQYRYNTYVHFFVPVAPLTDGVGTIGTWEVLEARIRANIREHCAWRKIIHE